MKWYRRVRRYHFIARPCAEKASPQAPTIPPDQPVIVPGGEASQTRHTSSLSDDSNGSRKRPCSQTIERAIQDYRELLGQEESALVKRSLWMSNEAKGVDNHAKEQTGMSATLNVCSLSDRNDF